MSKKLSLFSLVMLIVTSIDSIRNLPSAALFGSALIFFFVISAFVFLVPTALVAAELTATYPEKGGVYHWVHQAFGEKWAMVAIWMQWLNTMVWCPTILSFIVGTAAYLLHPDLVQHKGYLIGANLLVFWSVTFLNFAGLHVSSKVNNICGTIGTLFPMVLLIILGGVWFFSGKPLQVAVNADTLIPSFSSSTNWISLIAIMASFLGMELAGVHVNDINQPQRNFPKALFVSCLVLLSSMVLGSLAIAFVYPSSEINLISGVMQVFSQFFTVFHLSWLTPIMTIFIVAGATVGVINWVISPAKGLLHAAEFGYLPTVFTRTNSKGVPTNILWAQGILVSLFCFIFLLVPGVNAFYWFLTALSTGLYMIMYVLMFLAALKLHYKYQDRPLAFKIPGKSWGMWFACLLGILGCITTIVVSFFPPANIEVGSNVKYITMIASANVFSILPLFLFYHHKKKMTSKRF